MPFERKGMSGASSGGDEEVVMLRRLMGVDVNQERLEFLGGRQPSRRAARAPVRPRGLLPQVYA